MDSLLACFYVIGYTGCFCILDQLIYRFEGRYYAIHALHNAAIVWTTAPDVYTTLTNFQQVQHEPNNMFAVQICFALHFYHIIMYRNKLRFDDWLHHGLMVGVALPLTEIVPPSAILGHSMFFINGLPGMIDYSLLFLVRNNYIEKQTEKRVNRLLNIWVRCPGCVMTTGFILMNITNAMSIQQKIASFAMAGCVYWNGIYFMDQVVRDYAVNAQSHSLN